MSADPMRLQEAIDARGMDQSSLARAVGLKPNTISELCAGKKGTRRLREIAAALHVSMDWLAGLSDEGGPSPLNDPAASLDTRSGGSTMALKDSGSATTDPQALLAELMSGRLDAERVAAALLASTLLRDQREAADAEARKREAAAREHDAEARRMREELLAQQLSPLRRRQQPDGGADDEAVPSG